MSAQLFYYTDKTHDFQNEWIHAMQKNQFRSVCPYDCPDTCGLLVEVGEGQVLSVKGDPDHPFTAGFLCAKMNRYADTVHHAGRLTTPLLRTGVKGRGEFRPIGWDEAAAMIADKWQTIISESGAESILPYSYAGTMGLVQRNAGHAFFHKVGASQLERTICVAAKSAGWEAVLGSTPAPVPETVLASDLVLLWGINVVATNIHFVPLLKQAKKNGAKVVMIDTYANHSKDLADELILIRPGSDGALALGIMYILERERLVDESFIAEHVFGYERLRDEVLPFNTPGKTAERTGLDVAVIEQLARDYAGASAPLIRLGSALSRYANGGMNIRTISTLPALVGAYGKAGGGCLGNTSTGHLFDMSVIERPDFLQAPSRPVNMNQLGSALNSLDDPPIRSLYVYHSNPAAIAPDQNEVIRGLERDDLFTVVHERFMTDTARYADIVLPATSSVEHSDIYKSYGSYTLQRSKPVIAPVGSSKSNWDTFCLLAAALGWDEPFFAMSEDQLIDQLIERSPVKDHIDVAALNRGECQLLPADNPGPPFGTQSGRIEIENFQLDEPLPRYLPTAPANYPLRLMTAPALHILNSSFCERDDVRQAEKGMRLQMHPDEARKRGLADGALVLVANDQGEVTFFLTVTADVPIGVVVAEGAWWRDAAPGNRTVNALTSQRLTDMGRGSTLYDNFVEVRKT